MAMTRTQFVTEICDTVGKRVSATSPSGTLLEDRVKKYLNWAQKRLARHYSFHELNKLIKTASTASGVKRYPMVSGDSNLGLIRPKDIRSIRLIDDAYSRVLVRWRYRIFDRRYPRPENYSNGRPRIYMRDGNSLEMFRIPNDSYTLYIRYSQYPQDLDSDSQTSDFEDKDQLIVTAGIFETYFALEEYVDARIWYPRMLGQLKDAVHATGDIDWEPEAEPSGGVEYSSGEPWKDPFGTQADPLYGYE